MKRLLFGVMLLIVTSIIPTFASVDVVAATPELADIAKQIGGSAVSVYSVAKPNQDYHMIEPRPSDVSRIARADLVIRVGLDLDMWMDALINASGNRRVKQGGSGYVDASIGIERLEVPKTQITGASGDIHIYGNPHYFYDPENGKIIASNILKGLIRVSPDNKASFQNNFERFVSDIDKRMVGWRKELAPYKGRAVVTYHQSATYFLRRFGLRLLDTLEVKPGIPPSASHVSELIEKMRSGHVTAMVIESIYPRKFPDMVARETGIKYVVVPYSVGALGTKSYIDLIDKWVDGYKEALK
jgi:ABC-type Zn uptake system ZnuABC Zn-binding protein ZnuA